MKKDDLILNKKVVVGLELSLIILSIFAFVSILSEVSFVSGDSTLYDELIGEGYELIKDGTKLLGPTGNEVGVSYAKSTLSNNPTLTSTPTDASSHLSKFFKAEAGGTADALLTGLQWGVVAYGVGQLIGGLLGLEDQNVDALSTSLAGGREFR